MVTEKQIKPIQAEAVDLEELNLYIVTNCSHVMHLGCIKLGIAKRILKPECPVEGCRV